MIEIKNAKTIDGKTFCLKIQSESDCYIDATGLLALPGLIDPHVHFRSPGYEHKEDWESAALASISGGFTTVFDMPNTIPTCNTHQRLNEKKQYIDEKLYLANIPLRYHLYLGADKNHFDQIEKAKDNAIGIKVFMGSSMGDLMMDDDSSLHAVFAIAASLDLMISVHAEDESLIRKRKLLCTLKDVRAHSFIRNHEVAYLATKKAISLCKLYKTRLNILHVSTKEEVQLIKEAKEQGIPVTAETAPHYLFLNEENYKELGTKAKINPSLKTSEDAKCLMHALSEGVIDMVGSDHAPHLIDEKNQPYAKTPPGVPGIETTLPLLLTAHLEGKISLKRLLDATCYRTREIFGLKSNDDLVLVDLNEERCVIEETLKTKCGWSPYAGKKLKGWPVYTILKGKVYNVRQAKPARI